MREYRCEIVGKEANEVSSYRQNKKHDTIRTVLSV